MECDDGKELNEYPIFFWSGAKEPYHKLSNFYECRVSFDGITYPSSEHAFQAQRVPLKERHELLSINGLLADFETGFRYFFPRDVTKADKKASHWGKKRNIGILAKMLINKKAKSGESLVDMTSEECASVFFKILKAKYTQNEDLKSLLLGTEGRYLLEFDKGAERMKKKGEVCRWGGMVKKIETQELQGFKGRVIGSNQMGTLMMRVRAA